jgi:phage gpG-like protein
LAHEALVVEFFLEAMGTKEVKTRFERMGLAAMYAEPTMWTVVRRLMEIISLTFESQGRRGGGSWSAITQEWLLRKQRLGLDPRIGHATLSLRNSVTKEGAAHQDLEVTHSYARLGSFLPYADTQQHHRPFIKLTPTDRLEIRNMIRRDLIEAWRTAV